MAPAQRRTLDNKGRMALTIKGRTAHTGRMALTIKGRTAHKGRMAPAKKRIVLAKRRLPDNKGRMPLAVLPLGCGLCVPAQAASKPTRGGKTAKDREGALIT
jgi:hypothetical protein